MVFFKSVTDFSACAKACTDCFAKLITASIEKAKPKAPAMRFNPPNIC